jgi:oligosaccharyltransferase complex subunit alpha (ribophorin I)
VAAFERRAIAVHFVNNSPFVTFTSLAKDIEVSHWGNVAVQDNVMLAHTGAKLKGPFTRFDYERSRGGEQAPSSFRTLVAELPRTARDIYYRDCIGNVSTSHVRRERSSTRAEIDPRFPMFGGWESDFHIGYNLPSQHYLSVSQDDPSLYVLNISFAAPFHTAAVDSLTVRIILPEVRVLCALRGSTMSCAETEWPSHLIVWSCDPFFALRVHPTSNGAHRSTLTAHR